MGLARRKFTQELEMAAIQQLEASAIGESDPPLLSRIDPGKPSLFASEAFYLWNVP